MFVLVRFGLGLGFALELQPEIAIPIPFLAVVPSASESAFFPEPRALNPESAGERLTKNKHTLKSKARSSRNLQILTVNS